MDAKKQQEMTWRRQKRVKGNELPLQTSASEKMEVKHKMYLVGAGEAVSYYASATRNS